MKLGGEMTSRNLFGVLVRALGLYWMTDGLATLGWVLDPVEGYTYVATVIVYTIELLTGAFLLFKADGVVATCYSRDDGDGGGG